MKVDKPMWGWLVGGSTDKIHKMASSGNVMWLKQGGHGPSKESKRKGFSQVFLGNFFLAKYICKQQINQNHTNLILD